MTKKIQAVAKTEGVKAATKRVDPAVVRPQPAKRVARQVPQYEQLPQAFSDEKSGEPAVAEIPHQMDLLYQEQQVTHNLIEELYTTLQSVRSSDESSLIPAEVEGDESNEGVPLSRLGRDIQSRRHSTENMNVSLRRLLNQLMV